MKTTYDLKFTGKDLLTTTKDRQRETVLAHRGGKSVETGSKNGPHSWGLTRKSAAIAAALAAHVPLASVGAEPQPAGKAATTAEAPIQFDIPAQDLARALSAFTAQSHVQVLYEGDVAKKGLRSAPVKGAYAPEKALKMLLTGTPVQARFTGERTVTVEKSKAAPVKSDAEADGAVALGKVRVAAKPVYHPSDPRNPDYHRPNTATATRTDTPIMEIPLSIQVVPSKVLQDQQAFRFQDALKNVSGVQQLFSAGGRDRFLVRGFDLGEFHYRNGVRINRVNFDFANIQQVDVLKGQRLCCLDAWNPAD